MTKFVDVYVTGTGRKQRVPAGWLDHPVLGAPFARTPSGKVADLLAEIDRRNEGRDEDSLIVPASQRKSDLLAALAADDAQ